MSNDWQLLQAWREGDNEAGSKLVEAHFPAVSRFFRAKLGDDVEDIIQQTFLACVENQDRIQGSVRAYLFGIAAKKLYSLLRSRYAKKEDVDFSMSSLADMGTTPSEGVARNQRTQMLNMAMTRIPVESQIVLELFYWEELSGQEIAHVLSIEPGTVRSRLARARTKLKTVFAQLGGDASSLFGSDSLD